MKITELLESIRQFREAEQQKSNLPSAASLNDVPDDVEDVEDADVQSNIEEKSALQGVDTIKKIASNLGSGLYTLSAFNYNSNLELRAPEADMMELLRKLAKENPKFELAAPFFSRAATRELGAIAQMFVNSRSGDCFYFYGDDRRARFEPSNYLDMIDSDQMPKINELTDAWKNYLPAIKSGDEDEIDSDRDDVLDVLEFWSQKSANSLKSAWERAGFKDEESYLAHRARNQATDEKLRSMFSSGEK